MKCHVGGWASRFDPVQHLLDVVDVCAGFSVGVGTDIALGTFVGIWNFCGNLCVD